MLRYTDIIINLNGFIGGSPVVDSSVWVKTKLNCIFVLLKAIEVGG